MKITGCGGPAKRRGSVAGGRGYVAKPGGRELGELCVPPGLSGAVWGIGGCRCLSQQVSGYGEGLGSGGVRYWSPLARSDRRTEPSLREAAARRRGLAVPIPRGAVRTGRGRCPVAGPLG
ncbi:hypothetical protein NDU88_001077 [Pleurodeles waltl]|uniref:Uncharacterized protein n=1 Tax=Pleurodeles waltl TaxID=8319 RepID=A0AAV7Q2K6_PLEWA|nr:hypothetical protein NDU88_001077 [Pleurodeles waltl]